MNKITQTAFSASLKETESRKMRTAGYEDMDWIQLAQTLSCEHFSFTECGEISYQITDPQLPKDSVNNIKSFNIPQAFQMLTQKQFFMFQILICCLVGF
jgi:hypothetical protein